MTNSEKAAALAKAIAPATTTDDDLSSLIESSEAIVLNQRYPFGYADGTAVPKRYEHTQIDIAVELFSKRGAEGEVEHTENGVKRTYQSASVSPALLKRIVPLVGVGRGDA